MKKNIAVRIINYTKRNGLGATIKTILFLPVNILKSKIITFKDYYSVENVIYRRRVALSLQLAARMKYTVSYGLLKGFVFKYLRDNWGANMYLGIFEKEVVYELKRLSKRHRTLIDIGAADGIYAVGCLVAGMFDNSYCYETLKDSRENLYNNSVLNHVQNKIKIFGAAGPNFVKKLDKYKIDFSKSVILCDIEGGEFNLFDRNTLKMLKKSSLIIEIHDWIPEGKKKYLMLQKDASKYFKMTKITSGPRNMSIFPEISNLSDNDRWLICSEGRNYSQTWLVLEPKKDVYRN